MTKNILKFESTERLCCFECNFQNRSKSRKRKFENY